MCLVYLGLGKQKRVSLCLLEVERPRGASAPRVHIPIKERRPSRPEPQSLTRAERGALSGSSVLTGVLQAAPGESKPRRSSRAQEGVTAM